jgi:hypothetical protein
MISVNSNSERNHTLGLIIRPKKDVGRMPVLLLKKRLFGDFSSISLHRWFFLCFPVSQHFAEDDGVGEVAVFKVHIGEELIVKG